MSVNAPKPSRRKPVEIPKANDVRDNLQTVDPSGSYKFTLRIPMEPAQEFKIEAARRMIPLQELFLECFQAYKEKNR